ncbi:hypothetical protein [uncultured Cohaesibacter sp.]|uniref:hypothetical protein n=1 Tax=uncultured Cohaesibacter sp. TaxID=1002546 RepID=UPI0029C8BDE7|nr:hypothetical protein [uncultured Cohaesibacter sp.]
MNMVLFHWGIIALAVIAWVVPFWRIFPRAGIPAPVSLLMCVPPLSVILIWVLAFKRWPGDS